jgi:predicted nucleic acid-binding protein
MKHLLDASALLLLVKNADINTTISMLQDSMILDLTFYEIGNAIWKESNLTKFLTPKDAETLAATAQTVLTALNRITADTEDFRKILEISNAENLIFYDSSYIHYAKQTGSQLVTENKELEPKARKHVDVKTVAALLPK